MAYKSLIDKSLDLAFRQLKDLAKDAKFIKKPNPEYDFTNKTVDTDSSTEVDAKIVDLQSNKFGSETEHKTKQILVKTKGLESLSTYDRIVFDGVSWKIGSSLNDNGYVMMLSVVRVT